MSKRIDLIGQRFGKLTVTHLHGKDRWGRLVFSCVCDCGKINIASSNSLRSGKTKSCGCLVIEMRNKHGYSGRKGSRKPEYNTYHCMKQRCTNPLATQYKDYGGRGVKICDRWAGEDGFILFLEDMGNKPSRKHSLDRFPDKNGDYKPSNCRWATEVEQKRNTRRNIYFVLDGEKLCIKDLENKFGVGRGFVRRRISKGKSKDQIINDILIKSKSPNKNLLSSK